jgi:ribonuclease HI
MSIMIVIFCDGASYVKSKNVSVGVVGFRANEHGVVQKHLFSIQAEFSGKYAAHNVHEDFAVIKALEQAKRYPGEQVFICNDHIPAIHKIFMGKLDEVMSPVRYHIWKRIDLDILKNQQIALINLSRNALGMKLVDMVSKKYLNRSVLESQSFKNLLFLMLGKNYRQKSTKDEKMNLGRYRGNVKIQWKPHNKEKYVQPEQWSLTPYEQSLPRQESSYA